MVTHCSMPPIVMKEASSMRWADLCAWTDPATRHRAMKDAAIRRMRLIARAARKLDQLAARKVIHLRAFILRSPDLKPRGSAVGMWESRVLCEISKLLWK